MSQMHSTRRGRFNASSVIVAAPEPKRIQRRRTRGWRMPAGAIYVGRPSRWGNPYTGNGDRAKAVALFREMLDRAPTQDGVTVFEQICAELRGKDLVCWCPLKDEHGQRVPCHADVLLEIANGEP